MKTLSYALPCALAASLLAACANTDTRPVAPLVLERTGVNPPVTQDPAARNDLQQQVTELLGKPLAADTAVQIALINNPAILATYADAGIAAADVLQAGKLHNPEFSFKRTHGDGQVFIERGLNFNLLDLLTLPLAAKLEHRRYEAVRLDVAQAAVKLAADTRTAYYEAVAAAQSARYMQRAAEAAEASRELARQMRAAGNWSKLDQARQEAFDVATLNDAARAAHAEIQARLGLARLMGIDGAKALILPEMLPPLPLPKPASERNAIPIDEAVKSRLDVQAAEQRNQWLAQDLGLTRVTRFVQLFDLAAVENRNEGAARAPGYEINISIPLFDWGEAKTQRAEALYLQSADRLAATVQDGALDIRSAQARLQHSREVAQRYRDEIIPLRQQIADETLLRYNGMLASTFDLLNDAREQIADTRSAIDALKDYWIADSALRAACGGIACEPAADQTLHNDTP